MVSYFRLHSSGACSGSLGSRVVYWYAVLTVCAPRGGKIALLAQR